MSAAINPHTYKTMMHCLEMAEERVKTVNFDVCKKAPKLISYHANVSLPTAKIISVL